MKRREFTIHLAGTGLGLALGGTALAQGGPVEGKHYVRLSQRAPVSLSAPSKKVEVVEFFWYECPACNTFEPSLEAWVKRLPADVDFRRVPVGFSARHQLAQKLFYALEEMGQLDAVHSRIYAAVHVQGRKLLSEKDILSVVTANGVDGAKFTEAFRGFSVNTKAARARQLSDAYKVDSTPSLGVHGRFYTAPSMAGGYPNALAAADYLIQLSRK